MACAYVSADNCRSLVVLVGVAQLVLVLRKRAELGNDLVVLVLWVEDEVSLELTGKRVRGIGLLVRGARLATGLVELALRVNIIATDSHEAEVVLAEVRRMQVSKSMLGWRLACHLLVRLKVGSIGLWGVLILNNQDAIVGVQNCSSEEADGMPASHVSSKRSGQIRGQLVRNGSSGYQRPNGQACRC